MKMMLVNPIAGFIIPHNPHSHKGEEAISQLNTLCLCCNGAFSPRRTNERRSIFLEIRISLSLVEPTLPMWLRSLKSLHLGSILLHRWDAVRMWTALQGCGEFCSTQCIIPRQMNDCGGGMNGEDTAAVECINVAAGTDRHVLPIDRLGVHCGELHCCRLNQTDFGI